MKLTSNEMARYARTLPIAVYPGSSIEVLGYATENCENYAIIRRKNRIYKALIRYNGYQEPYCSLSIGGKRERVYLNDCRRCVH